MSDWFARAQARDPRRRELAGARVRRRSAASRSSSRAAQGAYLVDTDGNRYLDYVQSWGASILGHAAPGGRRGRAAGRGRRHVVRRADRRARSSSPRRSADRVPSVEKVRLVSSGTEAAMTAVRLARGATGRAKILKFAGCYHGHLDALLVAGGQRRRHARAARVRPASPPATVADTIVVPYNDLAALDAAFAEHGADLAAVLVEPVAANMGLVAARRRLPRAACASAAPRTGALLVFDEVITGFRVGPAGAQGRYGITPDLSIFGKVVGGGLPLAAVGGPAASWTSSRRSAPCTKRARSRGTRSRPRPGSPCSRSSTTTPTRRSKRTAARLADGLRDAFAAAGVAAQVTRVHTLVGALLRRRTGARLRRRQARPTTRATRASSTACSTAACTSRRAATRRCSRASRTPTDDIDQTINAAAEAAAALD